MFVEWIGYFVNLLISMSDIVFLLRKEVGYYELFVFFVVIKFVFEVSFEEEDVKMFW